MSAVKDSPGPVFAGIDIGGTSIKWMIVDEAGGFASFMNWAGPTYTDSGGFQVLSLGAGFKKVLSQEFSGHADPSDPAVQMQAIKASNAVVDDDGVGLDAAHDVS